jgi:tetratricopeptide (TPR) repeat protein
MADKQVSPLPSPSNEDLRIAAGRFEYANRASVGGNFDIAIQCLRTSCKLVPANLSYRQALRKAQKAKYRNKGRGSALAPITALMPRLRLWQARGRKDHRKVLEHGEAILSRNPWDRAAQLAMAQAAVALGLPNVGIWILHEARDKFPKDVQLNRALARLLEKEGHFAQAIALWELIRKANPRDTEAQDKARELAATETIERGKYKDATSGEMPALPATAGTGAKTPVPATKKVTPVRRQTVPDEALRARVEAEPTNPDHYLNLANRHRRNGNLDEARAILEKGLDATGQSFELALALADLEIEPLRRVLSRTEEQLRSQPGDEKLQKAREELVNQINTRELDCYRLKADHDPLDRATRYELGVRLLRAGVVDEAITELQAARSEARLQWKALMHLGYCFQARRNWPLAVRNFEEALRAMPNGEETQRKELLFHLAQVHAESGDFARAVELGLDLANLDFGYRGIGNLIDQWQSRAQASAAVKPAK